MSTIQNSALQPRSPKALTAQNPTDKISFAIHKLRLEAARQYEAWQALPEDQKLRHLKLEQHGMSEQDLDNLPPDERARFEEKLAESTNRGDRAPDMGIHEPENALFKQVISLASVLAVADVNSEEGTEQTSSFGLSAALESQLSDDSETMMRNR
ncbi:MAG: hypothetical protein ABJJ37_26210 [Roseibium sp.]